MNARRWRIHIVLMALLTALSASIPFSHPVVMDRRSNSRTASVILSLGKTLGIPMGIGQPTGQPGITKAAASKKGQHGGRWLDFLSALSPTHTTGRFATDVTLPPASWARAPHSNATRIRAP